VKSLFFDFFDEAIDTDSEDNAGFDLSMHIFRPSAKKGLGCATRYGIARVFPQRIFACAVGEEYQ